MLSVILLLFEMLFCNAVKLMATSRKVLVITTKVTNVMAYNRTYCGLHTSGQYDARPTRLCWYLNGVKSLPEMANEGKLKDL